MSKRALVVFGGWDGHTPRESASVFAPLLRDAGYEVETVESMDVYTDAGKMSSFSLVLPIWTMGQISDEQDQGLRAAVREGVGLAGFHGGIIDAFRNNVSYQWMTGGQWVSHPGGYIPSYTVKIADHSHPITHGIRDFTLRDTEQYWMHVDPQNHILANTIFTGEYGDTDLYKHGTVMPYAWTKSWGKGKVFVAAWGHTFRDFDVPEAKEIVRRGLLWASR